jgi:hypothetical protein
MSKCSETAEKSTATLAASTEMSSATLAESIKQVAKAGDAA